MQVILGPIGQAALKLPRIAILGYYSSLALQICSVVLDLSTLLQIKLLCLANYGLISTIFFCVYHCFYIIILDNF